MKNENSNVHMPNENSNAHMPNENANMPNENPKDNNKKENCCRRKCKEWAFEPINIFLRIFFVFATILTLKAIYYEYNDPWEKYNAVWVWNLVDTLSITENIYCLITFCRGNSEETSKKRVLYSNVPGVISNTFMLIATVISIIDPNNNTKLIVSGMSFSGAMFGSSATPFVNLIYEMYEKRVWPKGVSFQKQSQYQVIEWFTAGFGAIGNSFKIGPLTAFGYGTAATMKFISLNKSAFDTLCKKQPKPLENEEHQINKEQSHTKTHEGVNFSDDVEVENLNSLDNSPPQDYNFELVKNL